MLNEELYDTLDKLALFDKVYENIRIVDPLAKKVLNYKNNIVNEQKFKCFDIWGKGKVCDNCVSLRAFNENKTFIKVEYTPDKIYMVTAIPFEIQDRLVIIELLKDTTDSMIFEYAEKQSTSEIFAMIDHMNSMALKDSLTGVFNRRYINEKLPVDIINAALSDQEISIIMADIDYFKKVNDTYGHLSGDEVLKNVANAISKSIKNENDWVSRFGGEEFLICLPGTSLEKAVEFAESLRQLLESIETVVNNNLIRITSSFGVCTVKPDQTAKLDSFIDCVDKKLYAAKNNGRNRVEY